ncbi:MAG: phasin family protein [Porticoccaceae bacterium]
MSDTKKGAEKTEEMTRKIWLAGLGAYGQGLDNIQQGYEKMSDQTRDFFEELVARGEKLEKETKSGVKTTGKKIRHQAEKNKEMFSEQLSELREKMSGSIHVPTFDKDELLEELHARINKLTETLGKLVKPAADKKAPAKKAPAKKAAVKKPTAKPAAKAPARKSATAKPAAAKTTTGTVAKTTTRTTPKTARAPRTTKG